MESRNNLSRLTAESQAGEDVVITKRGTPVARLVPIGLVEWIEQHPLPPRLARSTEELDAQVAENRDAWE